MRSRSQLVTRRNLSVVAFLAVAGLGCGDGGAAGAPAPQQVAVTPVTFVYQAATALDPEVAAAFPDCVAAVGETHIHPSWEGYAHIDMTAAGDHWTATFSDVPVGKSEVVRVNDPNLCSAENPTGVATLNIFANGVRLTQLVTGTSTDPGLALTVAADGTATP